MKKFIRTLSLLVCMALLMSNLPVDLLWNAYAFASEIPEMEIVPMPEESIAGDEVHPETAAEIIPETDASEMLVEDITPEESVSVEAPAPDNADDAAYSEEPVEEIIAEQVEEIAAADETAAFEQGYALVLNAAAVYAGSSASDAEKAKIGEGVVYVLRYSAETNRFEIAFNAASKLDTGWIDAACVRPMDSDNELPAYLEACAAANDAILLNGRSELPLAVISCEYPAASDEEKVVEVSVDSMLAETDAAEAKILSLSKTSMNLGKGEVFKISDLFNVEPEGASIGYSLKTSKKAYVSVNNTDGTIKAVKNGGPVTITITPDNGQTALKLKVTVKTAATKITLKPAALTLAEGMTGKLTVGFNSSKYYGQYKLESNNPAVADVAADGTVTAYAAGTAVITASLVSNPEKTASAEIVVLPAPERIAASVDSIMLNQGQQSKAFYGKLPDDLAAAYGDTAPCNYIYTSSNPEIAAVDPKTGVITANSEGRIGEATITVSAHNNPNASASCSVQVVSVALAASTMNLGKGEKFDLINLIKVEPSDLELSFGFKTSNKKIVSVNAEGMSSGVTSGKNATITITPNHGLPAMNVKVYVRKAATKISLKPAELVIGEKMDGKLTAAFNSSSHYGLHSYVSSDPATVAVDASGNVVGLKPGTAVIIASLDQNTAVQASSTVTVLAAPQSIEASVSELKLANGQVSDAFHGIYSENAPCNFVYTSSNPELATVDPASGRITVNNSGLVGTVIITAAAHNNPAATASCTVEVVPDPDSISLKQSTLKIAKGETFDITKLLNLQPESSAAAYTFKTSNKKVVSVTAEGLIKGVKNGSSATITITPHNGLPAVKVKVTVYKKPTSISLSPAEVTLGQQMKGKLSVSFKSGYGGTYTLTSDNSDAVAVNENGEITTYAAGSATITATLNCNPDVKDSAVITVEPAPEVIAASVSSMKLGRGQTSSDLYGIADTMCLFAYESDKPEVVSVDAASGKLTAHANGTADIIITAHNNPAARITVPVEVTDPPTGASLRKTSMTIGVGNTYDIRELVQLDPEGSAAGYTFKTSSKKIVSVDENGRIKGVKAGSATITIATHNGIAAGKVKVTVKKVPSTYPLSLSASAIGMQMPAKATVKFASGYASLYEIVSSNPEVATVDADGNITPVAPGVTSIVVRNPDRSNKPAAAIAELTVLAAPESIDLNHAKLQLSAGQVFSGLEAICPEDTMCNIIYSSDSEILSVDPSSGRIKVDENAQIGDTANITAAAHNNPNAQAVCTVEIVRQPQKAELTQTSLTIGAGDKFDIKQLVSLEEGSAASYTYTTSSKTYVTVDADGIIKGAKAGGSSNIKITTHNGLYVGSVKVNVKKAPGSIYLEPAGLTLGEGMQGKLSASFASSSYYSLYTIRSSDDSIASVDANGNVTAIREGSAEIIAETQNGKKDTTIVTVLPAPVSAEFVNAEEEVAERMQVDLSAWVQLNEGSMAEYTFTSSNSEVASIEGNILTALRGGQTEISVKTHNGVQNTVNCLVTVVPAPSMLDYNDLPTLVVAKGDTIVLPEPIATDAYGDVCPTTFSYALSSSYASYARIEGNLFTGLKAGDVLVKVSAHNGVSTNLKIKISAQAVTDLNLDFYEKNLYVNDDLNYADVIDLHAAFVSAGNVNSGSLSFVSNDPSVVSVEQLKGEDGNIYVRLTAVSPGEAVLTASAYNGVSADCVLHVKRLTTTLGFEDTSVTITEGKAFQLQPVFDKDASAELTYVSSNPAVAAVDEANGSVTAIQPGTAVITATTQTGVKATVNVKIIAGPTGVSLDVGGISLEAGESIALKPELTVNSDETDRSLTYSTSNADVASVDADGNVTAMSPGEAVITVETCNGHTAECTVYVVESGNAPQVEFGWTSAVIVKGDSAKLEFTLNKAAYENGFDITSSAPSILEVNKADWSIKAKAAGTTVLTLTVHPAEGEVDTLPEVYTTTVSVRNSITPVFSQTEISLNTYNELAPEASRKELLLTGIPENLIGTYELLVEDEALVAYDPAEGIVEAISELTGTTRIICRVYGAEVACEVKVLDPVYRAVLISEYNNSTETGSNLPFANNNIKAMRTVLQSSNVDGRKYEQITYLSNNPTQAQIKSAIETTFADAKEGDISLIYIVSHGYYTADRGYYFGTPHWSWAKQDTVITSAELMDWMRPIEGNVVLVLDSCKSGGFIRDRKSDLAAEGNISVLTAQSYDKNASYFAGSTAATQVEFLTWTFCRGLGYEYDTKSWVNLRADTDANGDYDGRVSIFEAIDYADRITPDIVDDKMTAYFSSGKFKVPGVKNATDLKKWGGQNPVVFYAPDIDTNTILYAR